MVYVGCVYLYPVAGQRLRSAVPVLPTIYQLLLVSAIRQRQSFHPLSLSTPFLVLRYRSISMPLLESASTYLGPELSSQGSLMPLLYYITFQNCWTGLVENQ